MKVTKPTTETSFILLTQVIELWNNEMEFLLNKHTLTQTEFAMLASTYWLTKETKNITQVNLCNYTGTKQMNTSILLRKLQNRKFLVRKEHPIDTRAKTVQLTPLGEQTATKILAELDNINNNFFQISKDNESDFMKKLKAVRDSNCN